MDKYTQYNKENTNSNWYFSGKIYIIKPVFITVNFFSDDIV